MMGPLEMTSRVTHGFASARLRLQQAKAPFFQGQDGGKTFAMAIANRDTAHEVFLLWSGEDNVILVHDSDFQRQQLVLEVEEPEHRFEQEWTIESEEELHARLVMSDLKVIRREGDRVTVEHTTPPGSRRFLLGKDETHLFIAQLPTPARTVDEAHAALRPELATRAGTLRQGEWFFVPTTSRERSQIEAFLERSSLDVIRRDAPLRHEVGARGTPHVAEQLLYDPRRPGGLAYARGSITQPPRHAPLELGAEWYRIVRNLEVALPEGFGWVD